MISGLHIVVCGSLVPDPLQSLQPVESATGPALKNETMLPSVLDPWAGHALYEAAHLAKSTENSKVYLVSIGPKAKLQQLMMSVAQKVPFELIAVDGPASGFADSHETATVLADAILKIPGLDRSRMLLFGGCSSASRDAGTTMQMLGEKLGITDQFLAVDKLTFNHNGSFQVKERCEGGEYQLSNCTGTPAVLAWATGELPEPPNNPQVGMANMRGIMPALQKATNTKLESPGLKYHKVEVPAQRRDTRIEKDMPVDQIAREIVEWLKA